jgi:hypothetical protein
MSISRDSSDRFVGIDHPPAFDKPVAASVGYLRSTKTTLQSAGPIFGADHTDQRGTRGNWRRRLADRLDDGRAYLG